MKKVLAGGLAALTAGATLAVGALAIDSLGDYVQTSDGTLTSPIIVVGDGSGSTGAGIVKDVLGAADIAAATAGFATQPASGTSATVGVSGGADLDNPNQKLYLGDSINSATSTLTNSDLPTLLADGIVSTNDGDYGYAQFIDVGSSTIKFGNSGENIDPIVYVDMGTSSGSPAYTAKVVFAKALNFSDTDTPGEEISLFGSTYTISSESTNSKIVLFGSGKTVTLSEGDSTTVNVGGTDYTISLLGVSQSGTNDVAIIQVDDVSNEVIEETSRKVGGLNIYAKNVFYLSKETQTSSATLQLGSQKIILQNATEAKLQAGSDTPTTIDNTAVVVVGDGSEVSAFTVAVAAQDSDEDHIADGTSYTDPVFGTFKLAMGAMAPEEGSASIETIETGTGGDDDATVKFTDENSNTKTVSFAHNSAGTLGLADTGNDQIFPYEGANVTEDQYIVVDAGEFGHLFEVTEIDPATASDTGEVTLKDVFSGASITKTLPKNTNQVEWIIDGQTYKLDVYALSTPKMVMTWGTGAGYGDVGDAITVYPTIKTSKGALVAFTDDLNIGAVGGFADGDELILPGNEQWTFDNNGTAVLLTGLTPGTAQLTYNATWINESATQAFTIGVANPVTGVRITTPGFVVLEEEDDDNQENGIVVFTEYDSSNTEIQWDEPIFTNTVNYTQALESDNDVTEGLDEYGMKYSFDTGPDQPSVDLFYPDYQSFATVAIGTNPTFSVGESTMETAVKITSPVSKIASEVSSTSPGADLILVGGPCANSLSAKALEGIVTCSTWNYTTGIIKEVTDAFNDGSKALVVAGTTADDTRDLAAMVMSGTLTYEA